MLQNHNLRTGVLPDLKLSPTMAAQGYSPLAAIEIALKGHAAAMLNDAN